MKKNYFKAHQYTKTKSKNINKKIWLNKIFACLQKKHKCLMFQNASWNIELFCVLFCFVCFIVFRLFCCVLLCCALLCFAVFRFVVFCFVESLKWVRLPKCYWVRTSSEMCVIIVSAHSKLVWHTPCCWKVLMKEQVYVLNELLIYTSRLLCLNQEVLW